MHCSWQLDIYCTYVDAFIIDWSTENKSFCNSSFHLCWGHAWRKLEATNQRHHRSIALANATLVSKSDGDTSRYTSNCRKEEETVETSTWRHQTAFGRQTLNNAKCQDFVPKAWIFKECYQHVVMVIGNENNFANLGGSNWIFYFTIE